VDAIDAALILQHTAGVIPMTPTMANFGDVNQDGNVDSVDAALILQYVAGILPSLPP
jgi:hypothetical protein